MAATTAMGDGGADDGNSGAGGGDGGTVVLSGLGNSGDEAAVLCRMRRWICEVKEATTVISVGIRGCYRQATKMAGVERKMRWQTGNVVEVVDLW